MKKLILAAVAAVSIASLPVKAVGSGAEAGAAAQRAAQLKYKPTLGYIWPVVIVGVAPIVVGEHFARKWEREDPARQAAYRDRLPPSLSDLMDLGIQASRRVELASTD